MEVLIDGDIRLGDNYVARLIDLEKELQSIDSLLQEKRHRAYYANVRNGAMPSRTDRDNYKFTVGRRAHVQRLITLYKAVLGLSMLADNSDVISGMTRTIYMSLITGIESYKPTTLEMAIIEPYVKMFEARRNNNRAVLDLLQ